MKKTMFKTYELQIYKQEFLAITGKNGVGKTTLMRVIFQIFRQNEGEIFLYEAGRFLSEERTVSEIGLVFRTPRSSL